jgi:5'-nucleotidase
MIILLDLDCVTADLYTYWLAEYNRRFNENITIDMLTEWDAGKFVKPENYQGFYDIMYEPDFFLKLQPMAHAIEVTKRLLDKGHNLFFVTADPYESRTAANDKRRWVEQYFKHIGRSKTFMVHQKFMVVGDVLFDDAPHNLNAFPGIKIAMDYLYNAKANCNYRVKDWLEFEKVIDDLTKFRTNFKSP